MHKRTTAMHDLGRMECEKRTGKRDSKVSSPHQKAMRFTSPRLVDLHPDDLALGTRYTGVLFLEN